MVLLPRSHTVCDVRIDVSRREPVSSVSFGSQSNVASWPDALNAGGDELDGRMSREQLAVRHENSEGFVLIQWSKPRPSPFRCQHI